MRKANLGRVVFILLSLLAIGQQLSAQGIKYNNFHWTYGRHNAGGIGAEGTSFTAITRLESDTVTAYTAFSAPIKPLRSAFGFYANHTAPLTSKQAWADAGLSYALVLPLNDYSSFRLGVQQNWHRRSRQEIKPTDLWIGNQADSMFSSTDFSAFLKRDHLMLGLSAEDALNSSNRNYHLLLGFRELNTNEWLKSSPFFAMSFLPGREVPEFRLNYSATLGNTLMLGGTLYKNTEQLFGINGGIKLFNSLYLNGAFEYNSLQIKPDAIELGLRLNLGKNRIRCRTEQFEAYDRWAEE